MAFSIEIGAVAIGEESNRLGGINLGGFSKNEDAGFLAGVYLPKVHPELPTVERFWLKRDFTLLEEALNLGIDVAAVPPRSIA